MAEHLLDVATAYELAELARARAAEARALLLAAIECKRFLKRRDDVCPNCGYAGHGGYVSVPATTSHVERWR